MTGQTQEPTQSFVLPGATVTIPVPEEAFPVHRKDWDRIRSSLARIKQPVRWMSSFAWTMVGLAVTSILAWLPWQAVESQLPSAAQLKYDWVSPAFVVVAIAGAVLSAFGFFASKEFTAQQDSACDAILEDMDSVHAPIINPAIQQSPTRTKRGLRRQPPSPE